MRVVSFFNLGGNSGSEEFTGTSAEVLALANVREICDHDDQFFLGQFANLSNLDATIQMTLFDQSLKVHKHDLRAKESIEILAPLKKIGVVINGTVLLHGMGFIVQAENKQEYNDLIKMMRLREALQIGRNYRFPTYDHTDIAAITTTTIATPASGLRIRLYKFNVAVQAACRLELRWTNSDGTGSPNIIATINFTAEGTYTLDFGDQGIECPNGDDGLLRIVTSTAAVTDVDVISEDVDNQ